MSHEELTHQDFAERVKEKLLAKFADLAVAFNGHNFSLTIGLEHGEELVLFLEKFRTTTAISGTAASNLSGITPIGTSLERFLSGKKSRATFSCRTWTSYSFSRRHLGSFRARPYGDCRHWGWSARRRRWRQTSLSGPQSDSRRMQSARRLRRICVEWPAMVPSRTRCATTPLSRQVCPEPRAREARPARQALACKRQLQGGQHALRDVRRRHHRQRRQLVPQEVGGVPVGFAKADDPLVLQSALERLQSVPARNLEHDEVAFPAALQGWVAQRKRDSRVTQLRTEKTWV